MSFKVKYYYSFIETFGQPTVLVQSWLTRVASRRLGISLRRSVEYGI